MATERALLDILHLFSPSLPIGAFAFSQGLEAAIESGHVTDAVALETWCDSVLRDSLQTLDCYSYVMLIKRGLLLDGQIE